MTQAEAGSPVSGEAESVERFRNLLDSMPMVAVQGYRMDGSTRYWNTGSERLYGYTAQEAIGRNLVDLIIPPEMRGDVQQAIEQMAATGEPIPSEELDLMRKDGTRVPVFSSHAVVHRPGRDPELFCIDVDLSDQKRVTEDLRRSEGRFRELFEGTILAISTLTELRDPYTAGHQERTAALASAIAVKRGLPRESVENTRVAGLLHDVGKMSIPVEILNKPSALSGEEMGLVREHPAAGYRTIKAIPFDGPVAEIVLQHHERRDGSGYPQGLRGDAIMIEAQILAVADTVEAMTSHRTYRLPLGIEKALEEIQKGAGALYDMDAVAACVELFAEGFRLDRE